MPKSVKLGEPIPVGVIETNTAVFGEEQSSSSPKTEATSAEGSKAMSEQIAALKKQVATLKSRIESGRRHAQGSQARPVVTATVVSLGLWALLALAYRRSPYRVSDVYLPMRDWMPQRR